MPVFDPGPGVAACGAAFAAWSAAALFFLFSARAWAAACAPCSTMSPAMCSAECFATEPAIPAAPASAAAASTPAKMPPAISPGIAFPIGSLWIGRSSLRVSSALRALAARRTSASVGADAFGALPRVDIADRDMPASWSPHEIHSFCRVSASRSSRIRAARGSASPFEAPHDRSSRSVHSLTFDCPSPAHRSVIVVASGACGRPRPGFVAHLLFAPEDCCNASTRAS